MIIAVTGLMGSGKSTVANILKGLGATVIDVDIVGWEILQHNKNVKKALVEAFGDEILDNTDINRQKLAEKAFKDKKTVKKLNEITHPFIEQIVKDVLDNLPDRYIIIDCALLEDLHFKELADKTILVRSDRKVIKQRLLEKLPEEQILKRIKLQKEIKDYDYVIINNTTLDDLRRKVEKIWKKIKE